MRIQMIKRSLALAGLTIGLSLAFASGAFAQAATSLTTTASAGGVVGTGVHDTAQLTGATTQPPATGNIHFALYGPNTNCSGTPVFTRDIAASGPGAYVTIDYVPQTAGTYLWVATYAGDNLNAGSGTACNDDNESVVLTQADTFITTHASTNTTLGSPVSDTATLSFGFNATGLIQFRLYGPEDPNCVRATQFDIAVPVNGNGIYTTGDVVPSRPGVYHWVAEYFGDVNNEPFVTACNDVEERLIIDNLTTRASGPVTVGGSISDIATLSGDDPTGEIYWELYGPDDPNCSRVAIFTTGVPVNMGNGDYLSRDFVTSAPGTYRWVARYTGDEPQTRYVDEDSFGNAPFSTHCNDPGETVVVSAPPQVVVVPAHSASHHRAKVAYARYVAPKARKAGYLLVRVNSKAKRVRLRIRVNGGAVTRSVLTNRAVRLKGLAVTGRKVVRITILG